MWPENSQTESLVGRARKGDANAVNELIERHRNAVHHLVWSV
jgi:RNA polymerase sigma-70 factor, ECF subfamily